MSFALITIGDFSISEASLWVHVTGRLLSVVCGRTRRDQWSTCYTCGQSRFLSIEWEEERMIFIRLALQCWLWGTWGQVHASFETTSKSTPCDASFARLKVICLFVFSLAMHYCFDRGCEKSSQSAGRRSKWFVRAANNTFERRFVPCRTEWSLL